jgi:hypothetical protein
VDQLQELPLFKVLAADRAGDFLGRTDSSSPVHPQVKHQLLDALAPQAQHGVIELPPCLTNKVPQRDVANLAPVTIVFGFLIATDGFQSGPCSQCRWDAFFSLQRITEL